MQRNRKIVCYIVRPVIIEVGDLTMFLLQIPAQVKADRAPTATLLQHAEFNLGRCALSGRLWFHKSLIKERVL